MACKDMLGSGADKYTRGRRGRRREGGGGAYKGRLPPCHLRLKAAAAAERMPIENSHTHTPSHCCASCTNDQRTCRSDDLVFENGAPRSGTRRQNSRPAVERSRPIGFCTTLLDLKQMDYKETSV